MLYVLQFIFVFCCFTLFPLIPVLFYWFTVHFAGKTLLTREEYAVAISSQWKEGVFSIIHLLDEQFPRDISQLILVFADLDYVTILYNIEYSLRLKFGKKFTHTRRYVYIYLTLRSICIAYSVLFTIYIITISIIDNHNNNDVNNTKLSWYQYLLLLAVNPCIKCTYASLILLRFDPKYFKNGRKRKYKPINQDIGAFQKFRDKPSKKNQNSLTQGILFHVLLSEPVWNSKDIPNRTYYPLLSWQSGDNTVLFSDGIRDYRDKHDTGM